MTHRLFSRNASSSRAIPFEKNLENIIRDPFIPIAWQKQHKGMQGIEYIVNEEEIEVKDYNWIVASKDAITNARRLSESGVTKQLCNRLLEPFSHITVLVTATEYNNWFTLRCPQYYDKCTGDYKKSRKDINSANEYGEYPKYFDDTLGWLECNDSQAEIHIQELAEQMWDLRNESTPTEVFEASNDWHTPFAETIDLVDDKLTISAARCARLSYTTHDGNIDKEKDIELHDRLLKSGHMSPLEHQLKPMSPEEYYMYSKSYISKNIDNIPKEDIDSGKTTIEVIFKDLYKVTEYGWCKNIRGFISYRHLVENNLI